MEALIAELEAAPAGSRELDGLIGLLVLGELIGERRGGGGMSAWQDISTAPKPNIWILARDTNGVQHKTAWGKTSHVPLYGWNYGDDVEDMNLWTPVEWFPPTDAST